MEINLQRHQVSRALNYTSRAVSAKPNIPILSNVLLNVSKNALKLSATNLEMGIVLWIPGTMKSEGSITVNAKYIADFVSAATDDIIDFNLDTTNLLVRTKSSNAKFTTIPSEEFPVLPALGSEPIFVIEKQKFIDTLEKVIFACSTDLSAGRIQQSGVFFDIDTSKSTIDFVGLDGFRLSKKTVAVEELSKSITKEEIIVPARYLNEAIKVLSDYEEVKKVEVYLSDNNSQLILKFAEVEYSIRLLEGPYPDYKKIMPDSFSYSFKIEKTELENALKVVNSFARGNLGNKTLFDFNLEDGVVTLQSSVSEIGEGQTKLQTKDFEGESDLNSAYTLRYLQDFVNHIKGDNLTYETKGQLAPAVVKDLDDPDFVHLIMPMRREV